MPKRLLQDRVYSKHLRRAALLHANLLQNLVGHCIDQAGRPLRLKPLCETAFRVWAELGCDHFDQGIQGLIRLTKSFDLLNRVKNGGVVATVVESSDPGRAPSP